MKCALDKDVECTESEDADQFIGYLRATHGFKPMYDALSISISPYNHGLSFSHLLVKHATRSGAPSFDTLGMRELGI